MTLDTTPRAATPRGLTPGLAAVRPGLLLHGARLDRSGPSEPWEASATENLGGLVAHHGTRPRGSADLLRVLDLNGLTGHGGAHVPTAAKWRAALLAGGPSTVVANGAESEPLSAKDATLLQQRPHLVLDGLALTAEALGARRAVVWLHAGEDVTRVAVKAAIDERRAARVEEPVLEVVIGPAHYLAGESSAIAHALDGGPALPTTRRRDLSSAGERAGRQGSAAPRTLVQNVETLARLALLARGYPPMPTMLLTVLTPVGREVIEAATGTPLTDVLRATGWMRRSTPRAVLLGGYGGVWLGGAGIDRAVLDESALRADGLSAGAGVVAPLPSGSCGLAETVAIVDYLASMSARQCGPCLFGLPALGDGLRQLAAGTATRRERAQLRADLRAVTGRGACHHPDGATRLIASALTVFAADVDARAHGRPCSGSHELTLPVSRGHR